MQWLFALACFACLCVVAEARFIPAGSAISSPANVDNKACECDGDECGCCAHIDIKSIGIDSEGCVNITYIPSTISLSITVSIDGRVIINETESAEDPDICVPIPILDKLVDVCVKFYDLNVTETHVSGCVELEFTVLDFDVATIPMGCFAFNVPEILPEIKHKALLARPASSAHARAQDYAKARSARKHHLTELRKRSM